MKLSAKPASSPGRSDKFPPPLMRFLRSNVGSRSRGRSRASAAVFLRKAQKSSSSSIAAAAAESTQEPSSPRVTCMGQVRVGRSRKTLNRKPGSGRELDEERPGGITRCAWFSHSLCNCPAGRRVKRRRRSNGGGDLRLVSFMRPWRDCLSLFQLAGRRRRRPDVIREGDNSLEGEMEPKSRNDRVISKLREVDHSELKSEEEDEEAEAGAGVCMASSSLSSCSPPKNALLLTRCRSAPYRSSSLACRFWGSPLDGTGEAQRPQQNREESAGKEPRPLSGAEGESRVHPEEEEEAEPAADDEEEAEYLEKEIMVSMVRPAKIGELKLKEEGGGLRSPPKLIKSRSVPARTATWKVGTVLWDLPEKSKEN